LPKLRNIANFVAHIRTGRQVMIKVYGGWPTRSFRVLWALEELGVGYELHAVDLMRRNQDAELMQLNPAGFLPVLRDGETVMVESIAIIEYLIDRYDRGALAPERDSPAHPAYLQYLHLGEAGLAAYLNIAVASRFFAPEAERANFGARTAEQMFFNRLGLVTSRLAESEYLASDRFSAADISVVYALDLAERLGLADRFGPELQGYRGRLAARDAYRAADAASPARTIARPTPA